MVMEFGIDTFSYGIIGIFSDESWKDILIDIFELINLFITHEVRKEIEFHHPKHLDLLEKFSIKPLLNKKYDYYLNLGFDSADASLIEITDFDDNVVIITEDKDMLDQGVTKRKNIIKLADFFLILYNNDFFTKKEFRFIINRLYEMRQISKINKKNLLTRI